MSAEAAETGARVPVVLLTGSTGQLGSELQRALSPLGRVVATTRQSLDLRAPDRLAAAIERLRPDVVVNAAASTHVDRAETSAAEAFAVNAEAPRAMASTCAKTGAFLVHFSTDYVFDGQLGRPYDEQASPAPVNRYGASKLAGDLAVLGSGARSLIVRIGWLYSTRRRNFLVAILDQLHRKVPLRVVADQQASPTPAWLVADATAHLVRDVLSRGASRRGPELVNFACTGHATWHEFAREVLVAIAARPHLRALFPARVDPDRIERIASSEFPSTARRPADTRLDLSKLAREYRLFPPDWRSALAHTMSVLGAGIALAAADRIAPDRTPPGDPPSPAPRPPG